MVNLTAVLVFALTISSAFSSYVFEAIALQKQAEYEKSLLPQMPKGPESAKEKARCDRVLAEKRHSVCGGNCTIPRDDLSYLNCVFELKDDEFKTMCCPSVPEAPETSAPGESSNSTEIILDF